MYTVRETENMTLEGGSGNDSKSQIVWEGHRTVRLFSNKLVPGCRLRKVSSGVLQWVAWRGKRGIGTMDTGDVRFVLGGKCCVKIQMLVLISM